MSRPISGEVAANVLTYLNDPDEVDPFVSHLIAALDEPNVGLTGVFALVSEYADAVHAAQQGEDGVRRLQGIVGGELIAEALA